LASTVTNDGSSTLIERGKQMPNTALTPLDAMTEPLITAEGVSSIRVAGFSRPD
jgi:hypothetical protein